MAERIRHSPNAYPRVKDTSKTLEQVDFGPIAKEMGAEEVAGQVLGSVNPVSFFALRERLQSELCFFRWQARSKGASTAKKGSSN